MDGSVRQVSVKQLESGDERRWDEFVTRAAQGTFFHLSGWKRLIEISFGYRTFYIFTERDDRITGIMPLTYVNSRLFGNRLLSNAFAMYGGPIAEDDESLATLQAEAEGLMQMLHVPILEFRTIEGNRTDWPTRSDLYVTFRKRLRSTVEENLKALPPGQSKIIRNRATKYELRSEVDSGIERFYNVYAESVRNLGTPVFSKKYFRVLKSIFKDSCDVIVVLHGQKPVASVLNVYFRDEVMTLYGGGTAAASALGANVFMYWEVMRRACERGCQLFDFGRSKVNSGPYTFKRNWGFQPTPLNYQYKLAEGQAMPDINPLNPKYQPLIAAWKRLPLPVANILGPPIVKRVG